METFNLYIKQLRTLADNSEIEQGEILEDIANQLEAWAKTKIIKPKNPFEGINEILGNCQNHKKFEEYYKNVCDNLAEIYCLIHAKNMAIEDELDANASQLYNTLNKLDIQLID